VSLWGRIFALGYDPLLRSAERSWLGERRRRLLSGAHGRVLEIGAGTGLNLPHYPAMLEELVLAEPAAPMARRLEARAASTRPATVVRAGAERMPFADGSFDTVVSTFVLCTVDDVGATLGEVRRVLAPGGVLLFLEHIRGEPGSRTERWQDWLQRPWHAFACGCHCNRPTLELLAQNGFAVTDVEHVPLRGVPPTMRPVVTGRAQPA
jgi:Methylase involved in ubiquinone/menaquinone biosynthesis